MWIDHTVLFLAWLLCYANHSLLASTKFKSKVRLSQRPYRLLYNLIATITFLPTVLLGVIIESPLIFNPNQVTFYIGLMLTALGVFIIKRAFRKFSTRAFLGFKKEKNDVLIVDGIQSYIRHPLYTGTILIFLGYLLYNPALSALVALATLIIYIPFGIKFEEDKLIATFGEDYLDYKSKTPMLFPAFRK